MAKTTIDVHLSTGETVTTADGVKVRAAVHGGNSRFGESKSLPWLRLEVETPDVAGDFCSNGRTRAAGVA